MIPRKITEYVGKQINTLYILPNDNWHREDGPAHRIDYPDGSYYEGWWHEDNLHRYGGPAISYENGVKSYYVHNEDVSHEVEEWLSGMGYVWENMSDIEKWELDLFMRSLG